MMEILLTIMGLTFAFGYLLEKATNFIKQLKSSGSARLSKGFKAELFVVPIDKKSEVCAHTQTPSKNDYD